MGQADFLRAQGGNMPGLAVPPTPQLGATVHVVSRLTPAVMSFLEPTLRAMAAMGVPQVLLMQDDDYSRAQQAAFPPSLDLRLLVDHRHALQRRRALGRELQALLQAEPVAALHLHGVLAGMVGMRVLRRLPQRPVEVRFTPHSSRSYALPAVLRRLLAPALRRSVGGRDFRTIVSLPGETAQVAALTGTPAQIVECAVPEVFFDTPRADARRPLLIAATALHSRLAIDRYARIAVLLGDERLGISFNWLGSTDDDGTALLRAAGIGQFSAESAAARAQRLGTAWVFVMPVQERGFPVRLVEAMAAGMACVAVDSPGHRQVIVDGQTGFLCADVPAMLQRIAVLVDDPALRQRIGQAARSLAVQRFSQAVFERQLRHALGQTAQADGRPQPLGDASCC